MGCGVWGGSKTNIGKGGNYIYLYNHVTGIEVIEIFLLQTPLKFIKNDLVRRVQV